MKLSLPSGNLVITGLFIGVNNMVLLMPFMPLHLHIREFHFISRVAYKKVKYVGPGDTQDESIIEICYMGHLKGNSTSCFLCGTIIQCVFTEFLLHHCMSDFMLNQNYPVASEDSKPTEWAVTTTPLSFLSCCTVFPAFCSHLVKIY